MKAMAQSTHPFGAIAYLKRLYYDTAISAIPHALRFLQELVEPTQILFGSDYPYMQEHFIEKSIQELATYDGFNNNDRQLIERDNALKVFPRLRTET
jgi:predicted TIM-barrel fold metal-dependent hydrolase